MEEKNAQRKYTIRETLTGRVNNKKPVDMAEVRRQMEAGRKLKDIGKDMRVSESTLRRRLRDENVPESGTR